MARVSLPYEAKNNLDKYLKQLQEMIRRSGDHEGNVTLDDILEMVAAYVSLKANTIDMLRRGKNDASLPVALKIVEFLRSQNISVNVEDVFYLEDKEMTDPRL